MFVIIFIRVAGAGAGSLLIRESDDKRGVSVSGPGCQDVSGEEYLMTEVELEQGSRHCLHTAQI